MADITVTVAVPGATEGAGQIRSFSKETLGAATANDKMAVSTGKVESRLVGETRELKKATAAAKEYAAAIKSVGVNPLTGGNSSPGLGKLQAEATILSKRAQMFRDAVKQAKADYAGLAGSQSDGGGPQVGGSLLKRIGRGISAGGAAVGMGGPAGALAGVAALGPAAVGAAAAMVIAGSAASIFKTVVDRMVDSAKNVAEAINKEADLRKKANEQIAKQGLAAVQTQGTSLLKLIGLGGEGLVAKANTIAQGAGLKDLGDVQGGLALAQQIKDPAIQATVIDAAKILAQSGQSSFTDAVKTALEGGYGRGGRDKTAANILGDQTDRYVDPKTIATILTNIQSSGMAKNIHAVGSGLAREGEIGQGQIGQAIAAVLAHNAEMLNPLMAMKVEDNRVREQQMAVLEKVDTTLGALLSVLTGARVDLLKSQRMGAEGTFAPGANQ